MNESREWELVEEVIELLPRLGRLLKSSLCQSGELEGIPFSQLRVMSHLHGTGRSTVGEVAAAIGVSFATASELIDRLVENGLVERGVNPADRRQVHVWLTPRAACVGDRIHARRRAQVCAAFARLNPDERQAFVRGLRALVDVLNDRDAPEAITAAD